jgi:hypothetical protein
VELLHRKSAAVDLAYYENPDYHDTVHRAQGEGAQRPTQIISALLSGAQGAIGLLALGGCSCRWGGGSARRWWRRRCRVQRCGCTMRAGCMGGSGRARPKSGRRGT